MSMTQSCYCALPVATPSHLTHGREMVQLYSKVKNQITQSLQQRKRIKGSTPVKLWFLFQNWATLVMLATLWMLRLNVSACCMQVRWNLGLIGMSTCHIILFGWSKPKHSHTVWLYDCVILYSVPLKSKLPIIFVSRAMQIVSCATGFALHATGTTYSAPSSLFQKVAFWRPSTVKWSP